MKRIHIPAAAKFFVAFLVAHATCVNFAKAVTFTWTQAGLGTQDWTTAANWSGSLQFVSGSANELRFFTDTATSIYPSPGTTSVTTNVPATLSMNTLTLNGRGANSGTPTFIIVGTNASTWTIGDGATSTVNLNAVSGGGGDRYLNYTIAANLELNQTTTTFTGGTGTSIRGFDFAGNITQAAAGYGITKSGTSNLVFSGSNSYTGATQVTNGILRLNSANALPGGIGATGGTSALTINGGVVELAANDFQRNLGTGSSQFQITGGTSGFSAYNGPYVVTVNGDASQELQWGSANFAPATLVLNSSVANDALKFTNKIDLNAATRTVQVSADKALLSGDIRTTSGTAGLTKTGNGALVLTGNNTYNGATTLSAGVISVETAANLGDAASGLVMNGGTLQIRGTSLASISGLGHAVTFNNNAKGFDINDAANTFTVDQALAGTTLTKSGVGTLVLKNNTTLTGATTATGGGTLVLDYSTPNNGSKLADTQALNLNGSNLVLRGGSHAEAIGSIVLAANTGNSISRDGGSTATIANAGVLTANNNSSLTIAEAGIVSTTTANTNGIQTLGRISVGSNFATRDGSNLLQAYSIPGPNQYTAGAGANFPAVVNQLAGGGTMTGSLISYALRIVNSGNSDVLNLGNNSLQVANESTILYAGGFDDNYTINGTATGGSLRAVSGNQPLRVNVYTGTLTVNGRLTSQGGSTLIKAGLGTLVAGADNTYTGATFVQQGVLRLANGDVLGTTTTGTFVQGGAALELSNNITVVAEALEINGVGIANGGALRNFSGSNTYGGLITIGASGARINADASTTLTLTGGIDTTLTQDVTFGGAGNTTVHTNGIYGAGGLTKDGAGVLTLQGANTFIGATLVQAGTLLVNGSTGGNSVVSVSNDAILGGTGTIGGPTTLITGGILSPGASAGQFTFGNNLDLSNVGISNQGDLVFELDTSTLTSDNVVLTAGTLSIGSGTLGFNDFSFSDLGGLTTGTYTLFDTINLINGTLDNANLSGTIGALFLGTLAISNDGTDLLLNVAAVPEPSGLALGALGLLALAGHLGRRHPLSKGNRLTRFVLAMRD